MLDKPQQQKIGASGTGVQAGRDVNVTHVGVSAAEARSIALDVAKSTFYELTGVARDTAEARVEEITTKVIEKIEQEYPDGLQKATDPDFQYSLFSVQKDFARTGDEDLGDLLVNLLVDRSKQDERNILQIVLNESLVTASKLTTNQIAALALVFLFKNTQNHGVGSHELFAGYLDKNIAPFIENLPTSSASYQHLEFAGCGSILVGDPLEEVLRKDYQGLFSKGFDKSEVGDREISIGLDSRFFTLCLNDKSKVQVRALHKKQLDKTFSECDLSQHDRQNILDLFEMNTMDGPEIRAVTSNICGYMEKVFEVWNETEMKLFNLTSVGMAIGHANIKRYTGSFADLSIWIN